MLLKRLLYAFLGMKTYLSIISYVFLLLRKTSWIKSRFPEHYYIHQLISPGDFVLDIGANLGYYSVPFSWQVGAAGKVFSVEPVPLFRTILEKNIERFTNYKNIRVIPFALGDENKTILMSTPVLNGIARHGLTKVVTEEVNDSSSTYTVEQKKTEELFGHFTRLDYIKCDVEGYEHHIVPGLKNLLENFKPILQIEISTVENQQVVCELMQSLGYRLYQLNNSQLILTINPSLQKGDYYFIHPSKT